MRQTSPKMAKAYDPKQVEERIYQLWMERGFFTPRIEPGHSPFTIIMPPPNVTGELHLGHALTATIEDIMTRWHRMKGEPTLWLPGRDHASIAAQVVLEQQLAQEGLNRHQLGRGKFLERMWQWMDTYSRIIIEQHKRLGASCDWTRERFTMDDGPSRAVRTTFLRLYRKGLIYRGERIINWCPRCATALSDLEVEHQEVLGHLYYIHYPLEEPAADRKSIVVATTRPETLLGDTAVAIHPGDERYAPLVGKRAILPVLKRSIPIIADGAVEPGFGTGAVKVTPAHDPVDFEIGQRQQLPSITVMNLDATMNQEAGPYEGWDRFACREAILEDLKGEGLLEKVEPHHHAVGHCVRCRTPVEPMVSKQWFVSTTPLAGPAIEAVTQGRIRIIPEHFVKIYLNWMENIRDWCISRQLWWGHRIPVWYCQDCGQMTVAVDEPGECQHCRSPHLDQDPDVLDTWFSSALWPHSTLGWPQETEDFRYFYPTSVMETGYDIIFFWVARMIMMGLENTGQVPFRTVYLHGLIRDERGDKMSKSKGNVLNPVTAIESYGTDALRFTLATGSSPGNDMKLSSQRLEAGRNFANKLWNAARFVAGGVDTQPSLEVETPSSLPVEDRWILSRLQGLVARVDSLLEDLQFGEAGRQVHDFLWGEFCDWYIEMAKLRLEAGGTTPVPVLRRVLETCLRLLHPYMPFITEEIWQLVFRSQFPYPALVVAPFPATQEGWSDPQAEEELEIVIDTVRAIRNARAEHRVPAAKRVTALLFPAPGTEAAFRHHLPVIIHLARLDTLAMEALSKERPKAALALVLKGGEVYLPWQELVDLDAERRRLKAETEGLEKELAHLEQRLADINFTSRAPAHVVDRERQQRDECRDKLARIKSRLSQLGR
ncbi:MAG: valine--tRNA ligase [Chloroflexi bacterium]|nr:valine--tRNA ligase [Chloroflexota bacterium]